MTAYVASLDKGSEITHIKKIIIENIPSGNATVEQVAEELGISARKLQRLLQNKGTTFLALLNETRVWTLQKDIFRTRIWTWQKWLFYWNLRNSVQPQDHSKDGQENHRCSLERQRTPSPENKKIPFFLKKKGENRISNISYICHPNRYIIQQLQKA